MKLNKSRPAIIIPTYNEADNISLLIKEIFLILPQANIIVVDGFSPDGTTSKVKQLQSQFPRLHLISQKKKSGRGQAVLVGFTFAYNKLPATVMVEMDADFSHRPQELKNLIKNVDKQKVVIGSRYIPGGKIEKWPRSRRIFSFFANLLLKLVINLKLTDYTNGFRAYPREAINVLIKNDPICQSYLSLTETVLILNQHHFKLKEIPCHFPNRVRGQSSTNLKEIFANLAELIKLKRYYS